MIILITILYLITIVLGDYKLSIIARNYHVETLSLMYNFIAGYILLFTSLLSYFKFQMSL